MKITNKTTKTEMKEFLRVNFKFIKDKNLADRVAYAVKAKDEKVTRTDLTDLVKEVNRVVDKAVEPKKVEEKAKTPEKKVEPKAENSIKKLGKKKANEPAPEKTEKGNKKPETKKLKKDSKGLLVATAECFPEVLELELGKYEIAHDITNIEEYLEEVESHEEGEILLVFYYSRRMLEREPYSFGIFGDLKELPNDLDVTTPMHISDKLTVAYQLSLYTEACYTVLPDDFEEVNGIRNAGTMQFQVYRIVEEG